MQIGLIIIATGKYDQFVSAVWQSARHHFLSGHAVHLYLFSDKSIELSNCTICSTAHEPWPGPTLHRYRSLLAYESRLLANDYLFMCDADMRFVADVGDELLGDLVATIHPGFFNQPPDGCSYDRNPRCRAHIPPGSGRRYYAGGFQGGSSQSYLHACRTMAAAIAEDERAGVMALWHDESHWNRYLVDHPPTCELTPSYCYPEGWSIPFETKILALSKNHNALRT